MNRLATAALGIAGGLLLAHFVGWAVDMVGAIGYPFQLDYGEGIVWQQADMILGGDGYRPLSDESFIVFHYPPVFHVVSGALANVLGIPWLAAGRAVSVVSTIGIVVVIGALTFHGVRSRETISVSLGCAALAGLIVFAFYPVSYWSPLARVDMIALFFTLLGAWFGLRAVDRPSNVFPSAVFFVLALFSRQTMIAAPLATFVVLLFARPASAWRGLLIAGTLGLAALIAVTLATSGEFLRHIVGYNVNSFAPYNAGMIGYTLVLHGLFFAIVYFAVSRSVREAFAGAALRKRAATDRLERIRLFAVVWFCATTLISLAVLKSGAYLNYLIEWVLSWALLIGLSMRGPIAEIVTGRASRLGAAAFSAIAVQVAVLSFAYAPHPPLSNRLADIDRSEAVRELIRKIRQAPGPVISDDMTALKLAGKDVVLEPAIFAELTSVGLWDEAGAVSMIARERFGLVVTMDTSLIRHPRAFNAAIDAHYPCKERLSIYRLHRPAAACQGFDR